MIRFAENLNKMIAAGLGGPLDPPRTEVAVGHRIVYTEASGAVVNFETNLIAPVKNLRVTMNPIQSGTGDPSPDNIRPISGHESVTVERTSINVWDEEWEQGTIRIDGGDLYPSQNTIRSKNFCAIAPGQSYYATCGKTDGGSQNRYYILIAFYDAEQAFISALYCNNTVVSAPVNARYFKIATNTSTVIYGGTYNHDISINYPSTDHDYHAYDGQSVTVQLGQTVYGGTLDVSTGKLTVTHGEIASYNGEVLTGEWMSDRDVYAAGTTPTIGAQVVYVLDTPQTIDLDPQQITTLKGTNNMWSNSGDVTLEYPYYEETEGY